MVFRRTRRMLSVLLAVLQGDLMYNAAVPSWLPIFGRLWGAAKPTFKLAEKYKDATDFPLQVVDMMAPKKGIKRHSAKLVNHLLYGSWIKFRRWRGKRALMKNMVLPFDDQFSMPIDHALNDTPFEQLMSEVLNDTSMGTTAVFAEAGIGKSIATTISVLKMEASQSKLTVLLRGEFKENLQNFFRLEAIGDIENVARCVFRLLNKHGICLQMVFDNAFDEGLEKGLLQLSRLAFEFHHHVIVIMQSKEMAIEVDKLNGARTRLAMQQQGSKAEDFRWSEHLARQYLNSTVMTECQRQNRSSDGVMSRWLNGTQMCDQFGGWIPTIMDLYISGDRKLGEAPPTQGQRCAWGRNVLMLTRPQRCLLLLSHSPERYNINLTDKSCLGQTAS